ncbi:thioesterase family protein [Candidatus Pacearchaeota archaeon]|nr:thioesterase family protein [Candidatus Pacearchaeota archaeon]
MALKDLGEKLHEGRFSYIVTHENDYNGHLNNPDYFQYCERARRDFLSEFGWSDSFFRAEKGVSMIVVDRIVGYRVPLHKGNAIGVTLSVFLEGSRVLKMDYLFCDIYDNVNFFDETRAVFVNSRNQIVRVPDFFLDTLRSVGKN